MKDILKEFEEKFGIKDDNPFIGYKSIDIEATCKCDGSLKEVKQFLIQALNKVREDTIREVEGVLPEEIVEGIVSPSGGKMVDGYYKKLTDFDKGFNHLLSRIKQALNKLNQ